MTKNCSGRGWSSNPKTCPWSLQLEAGGRAVGTARAAGCCCLALTGWRAQAVGLPAPLDFFCCRSSRRMKPNKNPQSAAQHHFLGPHDKADSEIPVYCSVYMCNLLQACPHHKLPEGVN